MALLIRHGHPPTGIGKYSLPAFNLYVEAAIRLDAVNRIAYISDTNRAVASVLGGDGLKDYVSELAENGGIPDG